MHACRPTIAATLATLATAVAAHAGSGVKTLYVDASAPAGGTGSSWTTAFRDLQDALDPVRISQYQGSTVEIRLAQGVYLPDRATLNRGATFQLGGIAVASGVPGFAYGGLALMGGYAGRASATPDQRDPAAFVTVLSGDLSRNDAPNFVNRADNAYNVITVANVSLSAVVLDGLTISGGNATFVNGAQRGGGIYSPAYSLSTLLVRNCHVTDNAATTGAGIWSMGPLFVRNSIIESNRATGLINSADNFDRGAGGVGAQTLYMSGSTVRNNTSTAPNSTGGGICARVVYQLDDCSIVNNSAQLGGGLRATDYVIVNRCIIAGNQGNLGGGLFLGQGSANSVTLASITNSLIANNISDTQAAAFCTMPTSFSACTIVNNSSASGAPLAFFGGTSTINRSIVWGNLVQEFSASVGTGATLTVQRSIFQGGAGAIQTASGGVFTVAPTTLTSDPLFVNPIGSSADPRSWQDKDYRLQASSPAVDAHTLTSITPVTGTDLDGQPRPVNATCKAYARADMGAYELQSTNCPPTPITIYVRADAPAGGNGLTWASAVRSPWDALEKSGVGDVWIAKGTYRPPVTPGETPPALRIGRSGVHLLGGFAGNESLASQADPTLNITTISGDVVADDDGTIQTMLDNASLLLRVSADAPYSTATSISGLRFANALSFGVEPFGPAPVSFAQVSVNLKACTFLDNQTYRTMDPEYQFGADASSGALSAVDTSLLIDRCTFTNNTTNIQGGAVRALRGQLTILNSVFEGNAAGIVGGAVSINQPVLYPRPVTTIRNTRFKDNLVVLTSSHQGAGGAIDAGANLVIDHCSFIANKGISLSSANYGVLGGAISNQDLARDESVRISNTLMSGNTVVLGPTTNPQFAAGGAISTIALTAIDSTFVDNSVQSRTGAIISGGIAAGQANFYNCILASSSAALRPSAQVSAGQALRFTKCIAQQTGPFPIFSGTVQNVDPRFVDPIGPDALPGTGDENYSLQANSPAIDAASSLAPAVFDGVDFAGNPRSVDAPWTLNTGTGTIKYLDIGAFEYQAPACKGDFDASTTATIDDIFTFINAWFRQDSRTDVNIDFTYTVDDVFIFIAAWFQGC